MVAHMFPDLYSGETEPLIQIFYQVMVVTTDFKSQSTISLTLK